MLKLPNLETPPELAEEIANNLDCYGKCTEMPGFPCDEPYCRPHFVAAMTKRIREAVLNEHMLEKQGYTQ